MKLLPIMLGMVIAFAGISRADDSTSTKDKTHKDTKATKVLHDSFVVDNDDVG